MGMNQGNRYASWTWTCTRDIDMHHGHGHELWTWMSFMDTNMQGGHRHAANTWTCSVDMYSICRIYIDLYMEMDYYCTALKTIIRKKLVIMRILT
jgi:hypothetical protein